jgi:hypothetical protein
MVTGHQRGECHLVACHHGSHQLFVASFLHRTRLYGSFQSCAVSWYEREPQKVRECLARHEASEQGKSLIILSERGRGDAVIYNCRTRCFSSLRMTRSALVVKVHNPGCVPSTWT